jgi:hypothetical protein
LGQGRWPAQERVSLLPVARHRCSITDEPIKRY